MPLSDVTPLIITYNEEANIARVLDRLAWAERIVMIDSFSSDRTLDIARRHANVEIFQREFVDHAEQCNFGLKQISSRWVLSLDADYILSDECVRDLRIACDGPATHDGFFVPFRYCIHGRPLRGTLYPPRIVLFRSDAGHYVRDGHAHRLELRGTAGRFRSLIAHDDRKPLAAWLLAQAHYATLEAEKLSTTPVAELSRTDRLRRMKWIAPLLTLPYCLLVKGLLLDGWPGWYYAFQRTYAEVLLALKLIDRQLTRDSHLVHPRN